MDWAEARPGDVVFFPPEQGDPVSEWIAEADTGAFSHVGMIDGERNVVNAALRGVTMADRHEFDLGGILVLPMEAVARGRSGPPHLGRPAVDPTPALEAAGRFVEGSTPLELHKSGYSMSKALVMMAALCAAHSRDETLKELTLRAAGLWSVGEEIQKQETPSFICAEFVAQCYGMPFRWSDLERTLKVGQVPEAAGRESGPAEAAEPTATPGDLPLPGVNAVLSGLLGDSAEEHAAGPLAEVHDVFRHTIRQELALVHVVERLFVRHVGFFDRCLKCGWELVLMSAAAHVARAAHDDDVARGDAFSPPPPPAADDPELPFCLVTPRTLSHAQWFDWVRPVRFT